MRRLMLSPAILGFAAVAALPAFAASGDFRGEVDGRKIHLECKGEGRPAVILVSGYHNSGVAMEKFARKEW